MSEKTVKPSHDIVIPMAGRVLVRKDEDRSKTRGGLVLPDSVKIPVITARVVAIAYDIDPLTQLKQYDKVLVNPQNAIPIDFETDNKLYIVPIADVIAIFRKPEPVE